MFPITYKNRFICTVQGDPSWAADKLRYHLYQGLKKEGAENVHVIDKMIRFDGDPWHIGVRWHFFHIISKGKITVDYRNNHLGVVYQISFLTYFVLYVILPTCAWIVFEFLIAHMTVLQALPMLLEIVYMCWLLLFGGTVALNYYRFNRFMKDRLREFFRSASSLGVQGESITSH
jgi:hypothetical protein